MSPVGSWWRPRICSDDANKDQGKQDKGLTSSRWR